MKYMALPSVTCPVCGAKIPHTGSAQDFICLFCNFERRTAVSPRIKSVASLANLHQLLEINNISTIYVDGDQAIPDGKHAVKLVPLDKGHRKIDCVWSDMTLPFQEDLNEYFQEKFHQLKPGGLLYLSLPVKHFFHRVTPLPGQINFFKAKNIMFLLEQHGFKMAWRKNRFASILKVIARKS